MEYRPGLKLDPSWFAKGDSQRQFRKLAADDLHNSLKWKNLQLQGPKVGIDLDNVRQVAFKPDQDEKEFNEKIYANS